MSITRRIRHIFTTLLVTLCVGLSQAWALDCAVTDAGDSGSGTLRDCLTNVATDDGDIITIPAMTIQLTSGELVIGHPLIIEGASAAESIIDGSGNGTERIFRVLTNASAHTVIRGLTIRGARSEVSGGGIHVGGTGILEVHNSVIRDNEVNIVGPASFQGGGGIFVGDSAVLDLRGSEVANNIADGSASGGGILSMSNIMIQDSLISNNDAADTPAGVGGIDSQGVATIANTVVIGNSGYIGGGGLFTNISEINNSAFIDNTSLSIYAGGATFTGPSSVDGALFQGNRVMRGFGGGALVFGAEHYFINLTFAYNEALDGGGSGFGHGGGIHNRGILYLTNATFFMNEAQGSGGGIYTYGDATTILTHGSVHDNVADSDAGGATVGDGGGVMTGAGGNLQIINCAIGGNHDLSNGGGQDCSNSGSMSAIGKNIIQDLVGCETLFSAQDSVISIDPAFIELGANGGQGLGPNGSYAPLTLALTADSPAIDAAELAFCIPTDQRGVERPQLLGCDLGAFEYTQPTASPTPSPEPVLDDTPAPTEEESGPGAASPVGPGVSPGMVAGGGCLLQPAARTSSRNGMSVEICLFLALGMVARLCQKSWKN